MPFILQDGQLVEVTDAQFAAFGGSEAQLRTTTAAERRARAAAETTPAGGENIQVTSPANPVNNQQIINPNTTNNTPGQKLTPVSAPLKESDIPPGDEALYEYNMQGELVRASSLRNPRAQDEGVLVSAQESIPADEISSSRQTITNVPPIPGVEPASSGWARSAQDVKFTQAELNAAGVTNIPAGTPMKPVSSQTTTTTQETVTGGTETVTRVTPTTYKDTSQSLELQQQATEVGAQQEARAAALRAEGKTGGQILRDPEYRRLSAEKQSLENQAQGAKAVDQAGTVTTTTVPGAGGTINETTVDGRYLTTNTSGDDPTAAGNQVNRFVASGGPVQNASAAPVPTAAATPGIADGDLYRQPLGIGGNYSSVYNPETGLYDVVDVDTGRTVDSGLSELNAEVTASQFSQGDPQFETPEMPPELPELTEPEPPGGNFGSVFDPETQSWSVIDNDTGVIVQTGFNDAASAELQAQLDSQPDPYANQLDDDEINAGFTESDLIREPTDQDATEYLTEGFEQTEGGLYVSPEDVDPDADYQAAEADGGLVEFTADGPEARSAAEIQAVANQQQAVLAQARAQAALREQRRQANDGDWRVKLRLAPGANYLYRADDGSGRNAGILQPLANTDGVIFPYTPQIQTVYKANYNSYDLTHSNYRGYFYQNSAMEEINITATFTAQDTAEANYLLAVIHFFRSVTKMFYGQDQENIGAPPPLVFLQGLGQYQFNLHPCLVSQFNYSLPNDVDYIRAGSPNQLNTSLLQKRDRQTTTSTNAFSAAWQRLESAGGVKGGIMKPPAPPTLGTNRPTYVPTKIDMTLVLLPVQTRSQVSKQFSLKQYSNGDLLKGGFW